MGELLPNDRPEQSAEPIPQDLNSDADEDERRKANDDVHRRLTERAPEPFGESVAQIYGRRDQRRTDEHARNQGPTPLRAFGSVRSHRYRDRNRTWSHSQGQG